MQFNYRKYKYEFCCLYDRFVSHILSYASGSILFHSIYGCMLCMFLFNFVNYVFCCYIYAYILLLLCIFRSGYSVPFLCVLFLNRIRWSRGSVLAFGTQVRGLKHCRSRRIFKAKKSSARLPSEGK
jgi:hypothetical protein